MIIVILFITVSPGTTKLPVDCNVQRDGVTFPFLNTQEMSPCQIDILLYKLRAESNKILNAFDIFCIEINKWIEDNISLEQYKKILQNISAFEPLKDGACSLLTSRSKEISEASEYQTLHTIVKEYINWFSYSLLEVVLDRACFMLKINPNDSGPKSTYKAELLSFCKRCIHECPMPNEVLTKDCKHLSVKVQMPEEFIKVKAHKIREFHGELCIALGLTPYSLKLCCVDDGCIQVVFSLPTCIHAALFPLSNEVCLKLIPLGVMKICSDGYVIERERNSLNFHVMSANVSLSKHNGV